MMYVADAKMLATKKMIPTDPPNSGPRARLIRTETSRLRKMANSNHTVFRYWVDVDTHIHIYYAVQAVD